MKRSTCRSFAPLSSNLIPQELVTDESVYSRNRYFRLLFHAKFGKRPVLMFSRESVQQAFGASQHLSLQLLHLTARLSSRIQ